MCGSCLYGLDVPSLGVALLSSCYWTSGVALCGQLLRETCVVCVSVGLSSPLGPLRIGLSVATSLCTLHNSQLLNEIAPATISIAAQAPQWCRVNVGQEICQLGDLNDEIGMEHLSLTYWRWCLHFKWPAIYFFSFHHSSSHLQCILNAQPSSVVFMTTLKDTFS